MLSSSISRISPRFTRFTHSTGFAPPAYWTPSYGIPVQIPSEHLNIHPYHGHPWSTVQPSNLGFTSGYGNWNYFDHPNKNYLNRRNKIELKYGENEEDNVRVNSAHNGGYPWNYGYMGILPSGIVNPSFFKALTLSAEPIIENDIEKLNDDNIKLKKWFDSWKTDDVNKHKLSIMSREEVSMILLYAKKEQGLTFCDIAKKLCCSEFWVASAINGQQKFSEDDAKTICQLFKLNKMVDKKVMERVQELLTEVPMRGSIHQRIPVDPTMYSLYEILQVYGTTFKALLNEKFGDGIMSAVDVKLNVDKKTDKIGKPHVVITIEGVYENFSKW